MLVDHRGVLGGGPDGFGDLLQVVVGAMQLLGRGPQPVLVDVGELADQRRALRAGGEVAGAEAHAAASAAQVDRRRGRGGRCALRGW